MAYEEINKIVGLYDADVTAAEAHGLATGMLCMNEQAQCGDWLAELFRNAKPVSDQDKILLIRLFEETGKLLASEQFEFELLLPEDETMLSGQLVALKSWCQGFLYGMGVAYTASSWPGDAGEILRDIAEFTKLDTDAEGEEDEHAFMEITEYLRSAVLVLRDELSANPDRTVH